MNFKPYNRTLIADVIAGLSVASILLPEAVAYAAIAHLSIQHAITAVLAGLLCYACLGGSPFAIVAPTSSAAALMAAVIFSLHPQNGIASASLGFALVILTGVGLLVFAKAGLGRLSAYISRPVLYGFSFALAFTIITKQLPVIFGITLHAPDPFRILLGLSQQTHAWEGWSIALGIGALLILWLLKRWPIVPGAFVILLLGIILSNNVNLADYHIALVGPTPLKFPALGVPQLSVDKWLQLAELACGLLIIIVAESWGSIRSISLNHGHTVEPNRELFALGAANLLSGLFQGMPVGAGFSASVANEQAGAKSKLAGTFAALMMFLTLAFGQICIELIPEPIVAAAVINALSHALNPKSLIYLWRMDRDQYLALAAVAAVLMFGVLHGMLIAVGLSLAAAIRSFSQPMVKELGELDHTRDYVDRDNHPNTITHNNILILRPEEPLFFASVEGILAEMLKKLKLSSVTKILIISLEESADFDSTAAESLIEFAAALKKANTVLLLARVKDPIRTLLLKLAAEQFQEKFFWSVDDAVVHAQQYLEIPQKLNG